MERVRITTVAVAFAVLLAAFPAVDSGLAKALDNCLTQTGTTKDELTKFIKTGEADHNVQCTLSCGLQAVNFMKPDGSFDADYMKSKFPSFAASAIDSCISKAQSAGGDVCQVAYNYNHCFMNAQPKVYVEMVTN